MTEETMTRIVIEIDGKEVSSTTVPPSAGASAPPEVLERARALGATDAGSAPAVAMATADTTSGAATDAGAAPAMHAAPSGSTEDSKARQK
jgi:hypothetical protein